MNQPARGFSPRTAAFLVVSSTVGGGILGTAGFVVDDAGGHAGAIAVWAVGGLIAACGALSLAEVSASLPRSGGEFVILTEAYGPLVGFLGGWVSLVFGFTAAIAATGSAAASYLLAPEKQTSYLADQRRRDGRHRRIRHRPRRRPVSHRACPGDRHVGDDPRSVALHRGRILGRVAATGRDRPPSERSSRLRRAVRRPDPRLLRLHRLEWRVVCRGRSRRPSARPACARSSIGTGDRDRPVPRDRRGDRPWRCRRAS